jgi:hypothetical protein
MAKKRLTRSKKTGVAVARAKSRKNTKYIDMLLAMSRDERNLYVENLSAEGTIAIFEESYGSDLVNILLDVKKSIVKHFFETIFTLRKKNVAETATLYYYKDYLTNPLPLKVPATTGGSLPNYYAILGMPRDSSDEDLKTAFRLLAKAHHPEIFSPLVREAGEERLKEIIDAFSQLKSPQRRAKTDQILPNISYLYPKRDQSWIESVNRILE